MDSSFFWDTCIKPGLQLMSVEWQRLTKFRDRDCTCQKRKTNFISWIVFNATIAQNGHRFFLGKLQIDSNMHALRFVTFPVWFAIGQETNGVHFQHLLHLNFFIFLDVGFENIQEKIVRCILCEVGFQTRCYLAYPSIWKK
jgi:hypothetical protein